ncbi:MAG: secondary thiamine-phosphate synthase enzyme YjbQ [Candidatus Paceibacterota bacterium]
MKIVIQTSKHKEIIDITGRIQNLIDEKPLTKGLVHIFIAHTTASVTTADLDPGTDQDYLDAFEAIMPKLNYRHPHNPSHVTDHILSSIIGPSVMVPVKNGQLILGTWQRIVVVELNGPRERTLYVSFLRL